MRLEVVVAPGCYGCGEARHLAQEIQARYPALEVAILELDGQRPVPPNVVATPTYLLDGKVICLGNPRRESLAREIDRCLARYP